MEALPQRPTISLALIAKNEEKNVNRLLDSVEGCFDEIVFVDTGSTDKTKELAKARGCKIYDFTWVDDFSKARNFAFSKCSMDFIAWCDLDDVLSDKDAFIKFRDHAMQFVDYWFATYHYALDKNHNPIVSFVRERVFRRSINPTWSYLVHEGVLPKNEWSKNYITTWSWKHLRDEEDIKADKSRNIRLVEKMKRDEGLDARMQFYYAKELYEAQRPTESIPEFEEALEMDLQPHDRVLAIQSGGYAALAAFDSLKPEAEVERRRYLDKALDFAHKGIRLESNRAEFYVLAADCYLRAGALAQAVPYFGAAKSCLKNFDTPYQQAAYSFKHLYGEAPSLQLAKIYAHLGLLEKAKKEAQDCVDLYGSEEAKKVIDEVSRIKTLITLENNQIETDDIVFLCPPQSAYEFDEEIYKTKPLGGSETALIQMAKWLKKKTGRPVKVFNMRATEIVADSGVEYISNSKANEYFSKFRPKVCINWRHNIRATNAPTYLWCHDLFTPGVESTQNFDKFLALSPFHKNYTMGLCGVPEDKIIVTRNGIDPEKFEFKKKTSQRILNAEAGGMKKNKNKIVWLSSPDRGLERALDVMELVRKEFPDAELHVYYGIENLYKYGPQMSALADRLKAKMAERPWIKYHGFTEQSKMYEEVSDAAIWCHPNSFIETFCITAIECLANGIFPVVRRLGALSDTLREAEKNRQAILLDYDWNDPSSIKVHADAICRALLNRQWYNLHCDVADGGMVSFDFDFHSWERISEEWVDFMGLKSEHGTLIDDKLIVASESTTA